MTAGPASTPTHNTAAQGAAAPRAVFRLAALPVAGLLLFAAVAKALTKLPPSTDLVGWAQIIGEPIAALALLAFATRRLAWTGAALLFAAFTGFTLYRLTAGATSCGCFGSLSIPPRITLGIDLAVVALSLLMLRLLRASANGLALLAAALLPAAVAGALYSATIPTAEDFRAPDAFRDALQADIPAPTGAASPAAPAPQPADAFDPLASAVQALRVLPRVASNIRPGFSADWLARLTQATAPDAGPWLVFVWDPHCEVCKRFQPFIDGYARSAQQSADPHLQAVLITKEDLVPFGIEDWAWPASPTTFLLHNGRVVHEWGAEQTPDAVQLRDQIRDRGASFLDELRAAHKPLTP